MLHQITLTLMTISLLFSTWSTPHNKSYSAERFDVDVSVEEGGTLWVTETLTLDFTGGPFTYVFRELPTDHTDGISDIHAEMDGEALPAGENTGQVEIEGNDPIRITWHFAPTSDSSHTYTLRYRVAGVVRQESNADILLWQALPDEHEYPIAGSRVRIHYPAHTTLLGTPEVRAGHATVETTDQTAIFTANDVKSDETLVVALSFPSGSLISTAPAWQTRSDNTKAMMPSILAVIAGSVVLGIIIAMLTRRRFTYEGKDTGIVQTRPPDALPPAIAGAVANNGNMTPSWDYALGTIFDLAQRGVLSIEEVERRSWLSGRDFVIKLNEQFAGLKEHERGLLDALFLTKHGRTSAVLFSKLQGNLYTRLRLFKEPLKAELERMGAFDPDRRQGRSRVVRGSLALLLGGTLAILLGLLLSLIWAILAAIGVATIGLITLIASASVIPLSEEWQLRAVSWRQFRHYLQDVTRRRETLALQGMAVDYLPYAAAMGMATTWSNYMKKHEDIEVPTWFRALAGTRDQNYAAFIVMVSAAHSTGASSGTTATGAAGAAAGGGASGAG